MDGHKCENLEVIVDNEKVLMRSALLPLGRLRSEVVPLRRVITTIKKVSGGKQPETISTGSVPLPAP